MTTHSGSRQVVIGVDTHKITHHGAAVDADTGKLLDEREFPATPAGYRQLLSWARALGTLVKAGLEGTGSYGAGLQRFLHAHDVRVIEVSRPNRQDRRRRGKSDPIDAINAARAVLSEAAVATPKDRQGYVESVREIRATRRSAVKARKAALHQIHGLLWCAPDDVRTKLSSYDRAALVARCARLRVPIKGTLDDPTVTARRMLRRLAKRIQMLDEEITQANQELEAILTAHAPNLLAVNGVGTEVAGQMLTTAGQNVDRLKSEASLARMCGVAPIPASSGNTTRHRLHRGGDRDANSSIYLIVVNRLRWHEPTKAYVARRTAEGKTKKEIIRCLKRAVIRELYRALQADLAEPNWYLTLHRSIHSIPWPYGPTAASNLKCLCRRHHLLKTFWGGQSGWRDKQLDDGTIVWTAPDGRTHTTTPGSRLLFPELSEPTATVVASEVPRAHTGGLTMPRRKTTRAQDRASRIQRERELSQQEREVENDEAEARADHPIATSPPPF